MQPEVRHAPASTAKNWILDFITQLLGQWSRRSSFHDHCVACKENTGAVLTLQLPHAVPNTVGIGNLEKDHVGIIGCGR